MPIQELVLLHAPMRRGRCAVALDFRSFFKSRIVYIIKKYRPMTRIVVDFPVIHDWPIITRGESISRSNLPAKDQIISTSATIHLRSIKRFGTLINANLH
jgi:hypothetical protein